MYRRSKLHLGLALVKIPGINNLEVKYVLERVVWSHYVDLSWKGKKTASGIDDGFHRIKGSNSDCAMHNGYLDLFFTCPSQQ
jgi:hypothetical protein